MSEQIGIVTDYRKTLAKAGEWELIEEFDGLCARWLLYNENERDTEDDAVGVAFSASVDPSPSLAMKLEGEKSIRTLTGMLLLFMDARRKS